MGFITSNVHNLERVGRVGLGIALIGATVGGAIGAWGYIGVLPLVTGIAGTCPMFTVLGFSTCRMSKTNRRA